MMLRAAGQLFRGPQGRAATRPPYQLLGHRASQVGLAAARALTRTSASSPESGVQPDFPALKSVPEFSDQVLRGFGQVVFCNSRSSGAAILGGLAYADPWLAALATLGGASATQAGRLMEAEESLLRNGLVGYNGVLVGCAFAVFLGCPPWSEPAAVSTAVGGAASAGVSLWWRRALPSWPQWTFPFNAVAIVALVGAGSRSSSSTDTQEPASIASAATLSDLATGALCGVSQIFVVADPVAGLAILGGMAIYSPGAAIATLVGSSLGAIAGLASGADSGTISTGLWGFNPALTALMVSVFFVPSPAVLALSCGAAAASTVVTVGFGQVFRRSLEVPSLTLPFCAAATLCFGYAARRIPGAVLARSPHSPEENWRAFQAGR